MRRILIGIFLVTAFGYAAALITGTANATPEWRKREEELRSRCTTKPIQTMLAQVVSSAKPALNKVYVRPVWYLTDIESKEALVPWMARCLTEGGVAVTVYDGRSGETLATMGGFGPTIYR